MDKVLVTGSAGFIGNSVVKRLLREGYTVIGVDNLDEYYDVSLKQARLDQLVGFEKFKQFEVSIVEQQKIRNIFAEFHPNLVIHLAAQAGVRSSITNPQQYVDTNISGFLSILEGAKEFKPDHIIFSSSSSVYGLDAHLPYSEQIGSNHPISMYAVTKKTNELMAHSYAQIHRIPMTGLRYFTVYGPWGRPDMAVFKFVRSILNDEPISLYNNGDMVRDFTYIDDVVECIFRLLNQPAVPNENWDPIKPDPATSSVPYQIFNVGNANSITLRQLVTTIEKCLGKKAKIENEDMQTGDMQGTLANTNCINSKLGFKPSTNIEEGITAFVQWYLDYFGDS